jgi:hypothetical protein
MSPLKARNAADTSRAGMTPVEIVVVVAILLVLTSVLSFGIYNIYEDSKRQVATLEVSGQGKQIFVCDVTRSPLSDADEPVSTQRLTDTTQPTLERPVYQGFQIASQPASARLVGMGSADGVRHSDR